MNAGSKNPIGDIDTVDVVGVRVGGGLDLVLSASAPIDDSAATLWQLEQKIRNYIAAAESEAFLKHYGQSIGVPMTIYVSCPFPISQHAHDIIAKLRSVALQSGIGIEIRRHMGQVH